MSSVLLREQLNRPENEMDLRGISLSRSSLEQYRRRQAGMASLSTIEKYVQDHGGIIIDDEGVV